LCPDFQTVLKKFLFEKTGMAVFGLLFENLLTHFNHRLNTALLLIHDIHKFDFRSCNPNQLFP